jgi:hypothetical protein
LLPSGASPTASILEAVGWEPLRIPIPSSSRPPTTRC